VVGSAAALPELIGLWPRRVISRPERMHLSTSMQGIGLLNPKSYPGTLFPHWPLCEGWRAALNCLNPGLPDDFHRILTIPELGFGKPDAWKKLRLKIVVWPDEKGRCA
jgi:hypothetical protein